MFVLKFLPEMGCNYLLFCELFPFKLQYCNKGIIKFDFKSNGQAR